MTVKVSRWSEYFDVRLHRRSKWTVQLYLPDGANVLSLVGNTHWRHLANTTELVLLRPTQVHNLNSKSIGSAISVQLTAENPYTLQWATLPPKLPLIMGIWIHI